MLRMTDGVQDVQGMEYQAIKCLNTSLTPGIKVIVHVLHIFNYYKLYMQIDYRY